MQWNKLDEREFLERIQQWESSFKRHHLGIDIVAVHGDGFGDSGGANNKRRQRCQFIGLFECPKRKY